MQNQISSGLRHATGAFRATLSGHPSGCRAALLAFCADMDHYADALDAALSSSPVPSFRPAQALAVETASLDRAGAHGVLNAAARLGSLLGASSKHVWYRPGTPEARALTKLSAEIVVRRYALITAPIEAAFPGLRKDPGMFESAFNEVKVWTQVRDADPG